MANQILSKHHPTIHQYDKFWIGLILGLVVPLLGIFIVYLASILLHYTDGGEIATISGLLQFMQSRSMFTRFMSVGCIFNLGVFYLALNKHHYNVSRGVIFATMLVSLPVMYHIIRDWWLS
jgi:hypothetical protein